MVGKKALLVIDMQNDYLWDKKKEIFTYSNDLVENVNQAINEYKEKGYDIIYIAQLFHNIITNRIFIGFTIKGTEGAKLYNKLNIVSDLYFEKNFSSAYSSKTFRQFMKTQNYSEVVLCGLDECGCVAATAKGAIKTGVNVSIIKKCTGTRFKDNKMKKTMLSLERKGIKYI